jgi:hypothetical protein
MEEIKYRTRLRNIYAPNVIESNIAQMLELELDFL